MMKILLRILLIAVIVANFATVLLPQRTYASTTNITVDGEGVTISGYGHLYSGAPETFVNMQSDDGDTSIYTIAYVAGDYTTTWDFTTLAAGTINSVTIYASVKNSYPVNWYIACRIGGVNYYSTAFTEGATYTTSSYTWTTSPATGSAWTIAELASTQFGFRRSYYAADFTYCSYIYGVVDYTLQLPTSTTVATTSILNTSATFNGTITDDGGATPTNYGWVWDTVSRADPGNTAPAASVYANNWTIGAGTYAEGSFAHATGAVLAADTTYYVRFASQNSDGWAYGSELSFETVGTPSGTTLAATLVGSGVGAGTGTARLNATVTNANGQLCDVRFGYDTVTRASVALYANTTAWVENTYNTGSFPYVDITGLNPATTYYFRVAVRNDAGTGEGAELTFTTPNGINEPTSIIAIPYSDSISLLWVKGSGAVYTFIRYSTGGYPTTTATGTLAVPLLYTNNSYTVTGLTAGTTYYFSAWGQTGALYSAAYETVMSTTLAPGATPITLDTIPTDTSYTAEPSAANVGAIPFWGEWMSNIQTSYGMPLNIMWYVAWLIMCTFVGIIVYNVTTKNLQIALFCELALCGWGVAMGLIMLWPLIFVIIIALGFILYGERR